MVVFAAAVKTWIEQGKQVAIAVVARTSASSLRPAGSFMAVSRDGDIVGSVSAGCSEGAVVREAMALLESGEDGPRLLEFADEYDEFGVPAPCGGGLSVLIAPYDDDAHGSMLRCMLEGEEFAFVTALGGDGPLANSMAVVSRGERFAAWMDDAALAEVLGSIGWTEANHSRNSPYEGAASNLAGDFGGARAGVFRIMGQDFFACRYVVPPQLICVGAVHISACLAAMAVAAGYSVTIVDPRAAFLLPERFPAEAELVHAWPQEVLRKELIGPATAICVLTHDAKIDEPALAAALNTRAFYVGCLGSAKTLRKRAAFLREFGIDSAQMKRVYGPIGLYVGGLAPGDIAVSALAQIQAVRHGRIGYGEAMPGHTLDAFLEEGGE